MIVGMSARQLFKEADEMETELWIALAGMFVMASLAFWGGSAVNRKCNHPAAWIFYQHTPGKPQSKKCFRCGKTLP
jgi:hypothetical protein